MATLNIQVSEKAAAFAAAEATQRGLPSAEAYAAGLLEEAASSNGSHVPSTAFHDTKTDLDALVRAQGIKPISDPKDLVADFWPEDEAADEFLSAVRPWRKGPKPDAAES
jgi:hypothetical protein